MTMWLILTVVFAIATYLSAIWFDSIIPALIFLVGAIVFAMIQWNKRGRR